jgi:hypothetical protein
MAMADILLAIPTKWTPTDPILIILGYPFDMREWIR